MIRLSERQTKALALSILGVAGLVLFQNCSPGVNFAAVSGAPSAVSSSATTLPPVGTGTTSVPPVDAIGDLPICEGVSCSLSPLTTRPAVTTILLALGDKANDQLVASQISAQFIAESVVRYTSPAANPKILLVHDFNSGSESPLDYSYAASVLLSRYNVTEIDEANPGLKASDLAGYDIIWFNNPGHSMGHVETRDALIAFSGGVVLQGDDMSYGNGFSLTELTGLTNIDNGSSVTCDDGISYNHDDNNGEQYWVNLDPSQMTGASSAALQFRYGNDIDLTVPARADLQILATAKGGPETCTQSRPAITRYVK